MNIPMTEEINSNTKDTVAEAKAAILAAMPAEGISQTALDAAVRQILAGMPAGGLTSVVKSVQRGTIELKSASGKSATINAVDVNKSICLYGGSTSDGGGNNSSSDCSSLDFCSVYLKNATTVTAERGNSNRSYVYVRYEVVEFY